MTESNETRDFESSKRARDAALDRSENRERHHDDAEPRLRRGANSKVWLIAGGALSVVMIGFFIYGLSLQVVVPIIGLVLTVLLYAGMLVAGLTMSPDRTRLRVLAAFMGALALTLIVLILILSGIEAARFEQINSPY